MTANVGTTDRIVRIAAGSVIVVAGIIGHSWLGLIGLLPLLTATFNFCPVYTALGISTKKQ